MNWFPILDVAVHVVLYSLFFIGLWMLVKNPVLRLFSSSVRTARIPSLARKREAQKREKKQFALTRHLDLLLKSTIDKYNEQTLTAFYLVSGLMVLVFSIVFYQLTYNLKNSLLYGCLTGVLPYLVLYVRLSRSRAKASHDLLPAANKLIQKYRANQCNLYFALLELTEELEGPIHKAFFTILHAIQSRRSVEDAVHLFHYQIKTGWSLQLAILILDGIKENKTIENGLERMVKDMTEMTIIVEQEKSENRDAIQLGYFPIFALPITILVNQKISDGRAFHYNFANPDGRQVLIFTVLICSLSFLAALVMSRPKNDL